MGLFVDPADAALTETLAALRLDILQIYASAERAREVREKFGVPVWHAVGVATAADLPAGRTITRSDLEVLRPSPAGSLPPYELPVVVGKTLALPLKKGDVVRRNHLQ